MHTSRTLLLLPALGLALLPGSAALADEGHAVRDEVADVDDTAPTPVLRGGGWGHGVGMSQYGAYAMARDGADVEEILNFYYEGTHLTAAGDLDAAEPGHEVHVGLRERVAETVVTLPQQTTWRACDGDGCSDLALDAGTWVVAAGDEGLQLAPEDVGDGAEERTVEADELRLGVDPDTPIAVEVATGGHGDTVTRTMARGVHRVLAVTDGAGPDAEPALTTTQALDDVEEYLRGLAEMPSGWAADGGAAALEAQAVAGRTYAVDRLGPRDEAERRICRCHLRADARDQVYSGFDKEGEQVDDVEVGAWWVDAVSATDGRVLAHGEELAEALYSSSHHGRTERVEDSWAFGTTAVPYLRSIDDPYSGDAANPYRSWTATVGHDGLRGVLDAGLDAELAVLTGVDVVTRTEGGTPRELEVRGLDPDGAPVSGVFTHADGDPKPIAGASLRLGVDGVDVTDADGRSPALGTLPSSQIDEIGFAPFVDDVGGTHEHAAAWASEAGVIRGVASDRFAPQRHVTRAQVAALLYRAFDVPDADAGPFDDVGDDHAHADAIGALAQAGVVAGVDAERFDPDGELTRAQAATLLARLLALESPEDATETSDGRADPEDPDADALDADEADGADGGFDDVDPDGAHAEHVRAAVAAGLTEGCTDSRFCPEDPVSRGQMASFLHRAVLQATEGTS